MKFERYPIGWSDALEIEDLICKLRTKVNEVSMKKDTTKSLLIKYIEEMEKVIFENSSLQHNTNDDYLLVTVALKDRFVQKYDPCELRNNIQKAIVQSGCDFQNGEYLRTSFHERRTILAMFISKDACSDYICDRICELYPDDILSISSTSVRQIRDQDRL